MDFFCFQMTLFQGNSITEADINKLINAGYHSIQSVMSTPKKNLIKIAGLSETTAITIHQEAFKRCDVGFQTAHEVHSKRVDIIRLTTGSRRIDELLGGGVETGAITEVFGEFRTGKTQMSHTLAVTCQLPVNMNGGAGKCLYIDTEGTFRPERILSIANRYKINANETLDNIVVARAYSTDHQLELVRKASDLLSKSRYAIVIVDSVMSLYRTDYVGRSELYDRQQHLGRLLRLLMGLANEHGVAILLTNQVRAVVDGCALQSEDKKPIGGNVLAHSSTTRLGLRKGRGEHRFCKVEDSPTQPEAEASFCISDGGICDSTD